ncbi:MAG TPA: zinc-binding dehydrogenase [Myxococcota bacterium]|nr:zinc-binding dehydrogenase [Myxococcota bacterium]
MGHQGRQIRSQIDPNGRLTLSLVSVEAPDPAPDEVVVRIEASPLNPSDLGLLFGPADLRTAKASGTPDAPVVTADVPRELLRGLTGRLGQSLPVGNEGAGVVVAAGDSGGARALLGRTVSVIGGAMYSQYRTLKTGQCQLLPEGATPAAGASWFVNPLTALGMVETMRREGHRALVHTAAASNLGQMLVKLCLKDGVPLVNVVRRAEQEDLLRSIGARHVVNSSSPRFTEDLVASLAETNATIAFDAIGGGPLAGSILACMEIAQSAGAKEYSRYGSTTHKQVYIYGALDRSPTVLDRRFGTAWGVGGWLLTYFLQKVGGEVVAKLRARVVEEIETTFASRYAKEVSLAEALDLSAIAVYSRQASGAKYLVNPSRGA